MERGTEGDHKGAWINTLETGKGGSKSPKIRGGGVKNSNVQGRLNLSCLTPFYRDSKENPQFGGVKNPSFPRTTFGARSLPLAFGTF